MPHTPGPWQLDDETEIHKEGFIIASVTWPEDSPCLDEDDDLEALTEEATANAHLIAAAPELLAALKLIAAVPQGSEVERIVRAAIAKAEPKAD